MAQKKTKTKTKATHTYTSNTNPAKALGNVLYIKSPNTQWMDIAEHFQKEYNFSPALWISGTTDLHEKCYERFSQTKILSHHEMMRANLPEEIPTGSRCVDGHFLKEYARHEDIFYNMIDRWSGNPEKISLEKRRSYYIDMANAWFSLYEAFDIDLVIMPTIPHRLYDYMAYVVAQECKIPFIMPEETNEILLNKDQNEKQSLLYFIHDLDDRTRIFRDKPKTNQPSEELQNYIDSFMEDYDSIKPSYFTQKYKKKDIGILKKIKNFLTQNVPSLLLLPLHLLRNIIQNGSSYNTKLIFPYRDNGWELSVQWQYFLDGVLQNSKIQKRVQRAKIWYEENVQEPDLNSKFVYFAPSYQPERSSTPDAKLCQWTELMIEILANSLPQDWKIYYKEHPSNYRPPIMPDNTRTTGYYKRLKALAPNLHFVPIEIDPLELIDNAQCVATSTGTSAWQAVTRGVPAMIFGEIWFGSCPGLEVITNTKQAKKFIEAVQNGFKPNKKDVISYLCRVEEVSGLYKWSRDQKQIDTKNIETLTRKVSLQEYCSDVMEQRELAMKQYKQTG